MPTACFYLPESRLLVTTYWGRTDIFESDKVRKERADGFSRHGAEAHVIDLSRLEGTTSEPAAESAKFRELAPRSSGPGRKPRNTWG